MSDEKSNVVNMPAPPRVIGSMAEIEAADAVEYKVIEGYTPGQQFEIGSLSGEDILEWSEAEDPDAKRHAGARLICKSLVSSEKDGRVRYASDTKKNVPIFLRKPHKATERIVREILLLNGLTPKQDAAVKKD